MLETIFKGIILAVILLVAYWVIGAIVAALAAPAFVMPIIGGLLVLGFLIWVLRAFGISF